MSSAPTDLTLSEALRDYRERHILTQRELAKKLRIPVRSLQEYERGAIPHPGRRRKLLAFLAAEEVAA